jgi:hypothetical protein
MRFDEINALVKDVKLFSAIHTKYYYAIDCLKACAQLELQLLWTIPRFRVQRPAIAELEGANR